MHDIDSKTSIDATAGVTDEASPAIRAGGWCSPASSWPRWCWGFGFYGHGFYLAELQRRHGWPASLIAGASTLYYLVSALLVVFIADAIRRFGVRALRARGRVRARGLGGALPFVAEPWQLIAAYLVMALAWATMSLGAINTILGLWFESKRGLAISLALNGASFGGVVIVPALVFLAGATELRLRHAGGRRSDPGADAAARLRHPRCTRPARAGPRRMRDRRTALSRAARRLDARAPRCAASPSGASRRLSRWRITVAGGLPRAPDRLPGAGHRALCGRHRRRHHHQHGHRRAPDARRRRGTDQPAHGQPPCRSRARRRRWR